MGESSSFWEHLVFRYSMQHKGESSSFSVLHATQGVGPDQISRDCTPNHYYAMNSQLSSSQYNNQQQFISNYFPVHKPKSRRIRSAQPSHITGDNLVKIALNPSQPDSRIPTYDFR